VLEFVILTRKQVHSEDLSRKWVGILKSISDLAYLGVEMERHLRVFDPNHGVVKLSRISVRLLIK
jgi:hypothetical protein